MLSDGAASAERWLRADVREAIRMELVPPRHRGVPPGPTDLRLSLTGWASMLRRRRALVIARRHLIAGLAIVLAAEIVTDVLGGDRRAIWLLAPFALALLDGAIALRRGVSLDTVAQMLDRRLALRDRVVTALEILHEGEQPAGLKALVVGEASVAAADSFRTVRLVTRRPLRESLLICGAVAVIALLAALPGIGGGAARQHRSASAARRPGAAASRAPSKPTAPAEAHLAPATATTGKGLARPPLAVTGSSSRPTKGTGFSPYGYGGKSLSAKQLAREGIAVPPSAGTGALAGLAVSETGADHEGASSANTSGPTAAGSRTSSTTSSTAASRGGSLASSGASPSPAGSHGANAPQVAAGAKQSGLGTGTASSGSSPPGGNAAGSAPGSTALVKALVPVLGASTSGLPLQAGYAPSSAQHSSSSEGVSQTPNGGGKGGRTAHSNSGAEGSVSSNLSVIPPASNATPALDQGVLSSYFGSANQLVPRNW